MKYMIYIPDKKLMWVNQNETPGYMLLKLRRDCYKYIRYGRCSNVITRAIVECGGVSKVKFIMSDSIPFLLNRDLHFISYCGDIRTQEWLEKHPGRFIAPIVDNEEFNFVMEHRHDLDNAPDMYV